MGIVSILLVNIIDNDNDYCYHKTYYSWIELVRMYSLKGHICSAHKAWLTSNPRASLRAWDESLEIGQNFLSSGELPNAENALSKALELAIIYFSTPLKVIDKPEIEMFSKTVSELASCFSLKGETSKRNEIIVYGIDKLHRFMAFGADRITVLNACHLLMEAQQIDCTKYNLTNTTTNRIYIDSNRTVH